MSANTADTLLNHPRYQMALHHLQKGEWKSGLAQVEHLMVQFPLVPELRALRQDFKLRAKFDQDEVNDLAIERRHRLIKFVTRVGVVILVVALTFWGIQKYSTWLGEQLDLARQRVEHEIQMAQLNAKSRDSQAFLMAGRPGEAKALLDEIAATNPEFPGLQQSLAQAEAASSLETLYKEAMGLIYIDDWPTAKMILEDIVAQEPNYRDVSAQLANIEKQTLLSDIFAQAEENFQAEIWDMAVAGFESVRALHPEYRPEMVEERLFHSYVNAARTMLIDQADSLQTLKIAEGYFRKALALRPQNSDIKSERELARLYLKAQHDFNLGRWSDVITDLEVVYAEDPEYATGTARQTLYDAYVARGNSHMVSMEYDTALIDYQRAIALVEQDHQADLRMYEAQLEVAEALGAQSDYEAAVIHYKAAVEISDLKARALQQNNYTLAATLEEAESYARAANFSLAFERYRYAISITEKVQATIIHVVTSEDYLTLLACRYGSTVRAIVLANDIVDPNLIINGEELIIPVFP